MTFTIIFTIGLVIGEIVIGFGWLVSSIVRLKQLVSLEPGISSAVLSTVTLGLIFVQLFNYGFTQIGEILHIDWLMENLLVQENTVIPAVLLWLSGKGWRCQSSSSCLVYRVSQKM